MWAIINTKSAFDIYLPILFSFIRFKLLQNSQYSYPQQHRTHHFITNMMKSNQFCKNVIFQEFHPLQHPVYYQVNKEMKLLRFVMGKKENLFLLTSLELIKLMICKWRYQLHYRESFYREFLPNANFITVNFITAVFQY